MFRWGNYAIFIFASFHNANRLRKEAGPIELSKFFVLRVNLIVDGFRRPEKQQKVTNVASVC